MGKFGSFIRNTTGIMIALLLAHLGYKIYILTEKLTTMIIKLEETNINLKALFEILENLKIKWF